MARSLALIHDLRFPRNNAVHDVQKLARAVIAVCSLLSVVGSAESRPLRVIGTSGYLSEWEMSADLPDNLPTRAGKFSGPLYLKHVGLCAQNGPQVKTGEITLHISRLGSLSRVQATLSFGGIQCSFQGQFSGDYHGLMDCSDAKGVPIDLSFK